MALTLDPAESAERAAALLTEYRNAGVRAVIVDLPAPYDRSLLERVGREIRSRLQEAGEA